MVEAEEYPDGRWALVTVGTERFRVKEWLPDDPYPRSEIEPWPDEDQQAPPETEFEPVIAKFRRCMAMASEAGVDIGPMPDSISCDELGTMQMSAMLPIGSFDKQKLLGAASCSDRLNALNLSLDETLELIELKLRSG